MIRMRWKAWVFENGPLEMSITKRKFYGFQILHPRLMNLRTAISGQIVEKERKSPCPVPTANGLKKFLFVYCEPVDRHGLSALAMTRVVWVQCVCHCEEGAERGTRQSIVSRRVRAGLSVQLLRASGSPRAIALTMTRT